MDICVADMLLPDTRQEKTIMINWKVCINNRAFGLAHIPVVLLLVQVVAAVFGYIIALGDMGRNCLRLSTPS